MRYPVLPVFFLLSQCIVSSMTLTVREDPLKPIWDRMDQMPDMILQQIQDQLKIHSHTIQNTLNQKFQTWNAALAATRSPSPTPSPEGTNMKELVTDSLTGAFEDFYNSNMRNENEAVIFYNDNSTIESLWEVETKVSRHLDRLLRKADLLFQFNSTIEDLVFDLSHQQKSISSLVNLIDVKVARIAEFIVPEGGDVCATAKEDLQEFISEKRPTKQRIDEFEKEWDATYYAIVGETPKVFFRRDCSDIFGSNPESTSGVYTIYPSRDVKGGVKVWCDMDTGKGSDTEGKHRGWTVILRRRKTPAGLLNFNRTWDDYSSGFGEPGDTGEWWVGLKAIHRLTYYQPYEVMFLLHDIEMGDFWARYSNFRVEDESRSFRLVIDGFSGNVTDVFKEQHHGQPFSTFDMDNDNCDSCNCATNNGGGWWFNVCQWTILTATFPTSNDREAKTIRWLNGKWLVLDDVTMMIKPTV